MRGEDVQQVFETILPDKLLLKLVESAKFQERARKLDALRLLRAMVIAAATGYGGRHADVMRLYFESGATRVVRGVFYGWFGKELEAIMVEVRARALAYAGSRKTRLARTAWRVRERLAHRRLLDREARSGSARRVSRRR